jgi:hypothetical protein
MVLNKPGDTASTSGTYSSCFVSISGSGSTPADTANGGWNKGNVAIGGGGGDDAA